MDNQEFFIYTCEDCCVRFCVETAFEDQSIIGCPVCKSGELIEDVGTGVMTMTSLADDLADPVVEV